MKTPLVFKLILLLVLAWRLIISNRKTKKPEEKEYINLQKIPHKLSKVPRLDIEPVESIKRFYRDFVRESPHENQLYFICFLVSKLEKHYAKRGIYRLFWYNQELVVAFYQSLKILKVKNQEILFENILTNLNPEGFKEIKSGEVPKIDSFLSTNTDFDKLYEDFDKAFDLKSYCKALVEQFYANQ
jgi:hypothetical protein